MVNKIKHYRITISDMAPHIHNFLPYENKVEKITKWLINWITLSLECGKIKPYDFLPPKGDLAFHIGVSQGTIQNVFRKIEDAGYIESKQRIGSYIKAKNTNIKNEKLTSKRDFTIELLKKYIKDNYNIDEKFESCRNLSKIFNISSSTITIAMKHLETLGILTKKTKFYYISNLNFHIKNIEQKTLAEKIAQKIEKYISENLQDGDKLPTNKEFKKMFKTSLKTIHNAIKILNKKGILYTRRGYYGTIVLGKVTHQEEYFYEKIEQKLKNLISNCEIGNKLPSIRELAKTYNTSEKTIKKALDNLSDDGYIAFSRGRYGGTFVTDIPQKSNEAYKWLAISNNYIQETEN